MRLSITKNKHNEHLYITKSFRKGKKVSTKTFKKLGSMQDLLPLHNNSRSEVINWAKSQVDFYTQKEREDSIKITFEYCSSVRIRPKKSLSIGYLFLQDIFYDLKLDAICDTIAQKYDFTFNLTDILSTLVISRILSPSSKLSTLDFAKTLIEKPDFSLHHMYRALDVLSENTDYILSQLYKNSTKVFPRNTSVLYYDCSNFYFEIEEAEGLKQYGKSKEHRPNPIVQMGLFMDGNGMPLSFVIYPGNASEQPSLIPLEKKIIKDFPISKFVVCTDAGLASNSNRKFNSIAQRSFIVTQSLKKLKKHIKDWALDPTGWHLIGDTTEYNLLAIDEENMMHRIFYKERWIHENGLEQRLVISYSPKYKVYKKAIRQKQIDRANQLIAKKTKIKNKNPNSPIKYITEIKTTETGEVADEAHYSLNTKAILEEAKYDGFYGICTTLDDDIETILKVNKQRWEIEESFRIMKTDFKSRPVYLQKDNRIEAHFLTCFLSLLVYRILEQKLESKYTSTQIITTLREMEVSSYEGFGYIPTYERSTLTDTLHNIFGFLTDTEIITEKKMKKIIRQTKK